MESITNKTSWKKFAFVGVLVLAAMIALVVKLDPRTSVFAEETQMTFQSPTEAGATLAKAAQSGDESALTKILGQEATTRMTPGGAEKHKTAMEAFVTKYKEMNRWVDMTDGSRVLYVGADNFAFPVPLAKNPSGQWYFDHDAGAQEIQARDIGRNELLAIDACAAIANAEDLYFANVGTSPAYAERIVSTPGKQDGLYWTSSKDQAPSPLGNFSEFPKSSLASNPPEEPFVIDGYNLRILTAQGEAAPGGAQSYIVDGKMTGGFAILATPVKYGESGIMTFMTGETGIVYEQDLGPDTLKIAAAITAYNPVASWSPVE
jgi:Protein of unknown function (DUF2950)